MSLELYKITFDRYDINSNNYWKNNLFNVDHRSDHWENKPEHNWLFKIVRWVEGKHRIDRVSTYLLAVSEQLTKDYLAAQDAASKSTLEGYLEKCRHMLSHFQTDVLQVHNDRQCFKRFRIDATRIENRVRAISLALMKPSKNGYNSSTVIYESIFPRPINCIKDLVLIIFGYLTKEDLLRCSRVNKNWRALIKADPISRGLQELKNIHLLNDLFSHRLFISAAPETLRSVVSTGIDTFYGSTENCKLKRIDLLCKQTAVKTAKTNISIKALNDTQAVLYGDNLLQVYDHKNQKLVWNISCDSEWFVQSYLYPWDSITVLSPQKFIASTNNHSFNGVESGSLYYFDVENQIIDYLSFVPYMANWFVFANNTKCFINCSGARILVISLESQSRTRLAKIKLNNPTNLECHSEKYAVVYNRLEYPPQEKYQIWSLESMEAKVEISKNNIHTPKFLDQNTLIFVAKMRAKHDRLVSYHIPTNAVEQIEIPFDLVTHQRIQNFYIVSTNQFLIIAHPADNPQAQSIYAWNTVTLKLQFISVHEVNGTKKIEKLKDNVWLMHDPMTYLIFDESDEVKVVHPLGFRAVDTAVNGNTMLITSLAAPKTQTILKLI